jgi:hypothetical protein
MVDSHVQRLYHAALLDCTLLEWEERRKAARWPYIGRLMQ